MPAADCQKSVDHQIDISEFIIGVLNVLIFHNTRNAATIPMKIGTFLVEFTLFIFAALFVMLLLVIGVVLAIMGEMLARCMHWIHVYKTCIERERDGVITRKAKLILKRHTMNRVDMSDLSNVSNPAIVPNPAIAPNLAIVPNPAVAPNTDAPADPSADVIKQKHRHRSREGKGKKSKKGKI